jgi:hypothetical protein
MHQIKVLSNHSAVSLSDECLQPVSLICMYDQTGRVVGRELRKICVAGVVQKIRRAGKPSHCGNDADLLAIRTFAVPRPPRSPQRPTHVANEHVLDRFMVRRLLT